MAMYQSKMPMHGQGTMVHVGPDVMDDPQYRAQKVKVCGDGLRVGHIGNENKINIDCIEAGAGNLTVDCRGPDDQTARCLLYDNRDATYTLYLKPQTRGHHVLEIKFDGMHVCGSPFQMYVGRPPDPRKVHVYGPGIEHGVVGDNNGSFSVDVREAGAGELLVTVKGPAGGYQLEMERPSRQSREIICKYNPKEPGEYLINVTWSGDHVNGSPFVVRMFNTSDELDYYLEHGGQGDVAFFPK